MTVLLLANKELKEELFAHPVSEDVRLQWITDPAQANPGESIDVCIDLLFDNTTERIIWLKNLATSLIIINSVSITLQEIQESFVRINGWNTFLKRNCIEASGMDPLKQQKTDELFLYFNRTIKWLPDIAGFITPRVVASIVNEAFFTLQEGVSTEEEIDTAMRLGTNYPFGPFEWGKKIGLPVIYHLLERLGQQETRYKPAPLLTQTALA